MKTIDYITKEGDDYHQTRHRQLFNNKPLLFSWSEYARNRYFPKILTNSNILEIGAGTGQNLLSVCKSANVLAVEPSQYARDFCCSLGITTYESIDDLPDIKFDFILLRHVLEHVSEPLKMLEQIKPLMADTGILCVVIPLENPLKSSDPNDIDYHNYCWNKQTITNFLNTAGFNKKLLKFNWFNGRNLFFPIYKLLGIHVYSICLTIIGLIRLKGEIVCWVSKNEIYRQL